MRSGQISALQWLQLLLTENTHEREHMKENANTQGMGQLLDEAMVRELVEDGLIVQRPGTPQPTFALTPEGKRMAQALIKEHHAQG